MCGIVGWTDFSRNLANQGEILAAMADRLISRGPDASGYWFSKHAAFGHRRLVVVDPEGGKQPMCRQKGDSVYVLAYNGELYNTEDIRRELAARGYAFKGWSDTEVLLLAYMEWGEKCLEKLNGIYAFAVWDAKKEQLFLARDRIGVKPLFYSQQGTAFLFASEIKGILAHPLVSPRINREGLAEIFVMGPARTPGHGVFSGIYELKPGYSMIVDRRGVRTQQYWRLISHSHEEDLNGTIISVRELVTDSIKRQLVSDVPLCTLLSGGLDSSAITAIAADAYQKEGKIPIRTFSVDYEGNEEYFRENEFQPNSDGPWAKKVSDYLGTDHCCFYIETNKLTDSLLPAVLARDLPGMADVDSSLYLFSCEIKKQATVGLSGECADEVFGGYPWFYQRQDKGTAAFPWSRRISERIKFFSPQLLDLIKPEEYIEERCQEALEEVPRFSGDSAEDARMREMFYLNLTRWMPTLLDRKDRMSMAVGLELRVPFCDHRLVEYMWNVPWEMKNHKNREKGLLREALKGILPDDVLWRKKSPYPKTHNPAYLEAVRSGMLRILDDKSSPLLPFINREALKDFVLSARSDTNFPWFGQLMNAPQLLAFLIQVDYWFRQYKVNVDG